MITELLAHMIILMFPTPSTVVTDDAGNCVFWFYNYEPEKRNPCGKDDEFVPENAMPIDENEYENTNTCP